MKFFIPHAKDKEEEIEVYNAIKKFAKENLGWSISDRRIFSIDYVHDGKRYYAEVGKVENLIGEEVQAILESNTYLICTPNRGVLRGEPILVGLESVYSVVDFDK